MGMEVLLERDYGMFFDIGDSISFYSYEGKRYKGFVSKTNVLDANRYRKSTDIKHTRHVLIEKTREIWKIK
jgi:hypothetical protein